MQNYEHWYKIKNLREFNKLSQNELAEKLDISQGQLCKIESGWVEKIDFLLMDRISKIFGKDLEYFLENSVVNNNVKENKGQISCDNVTINNPYSELLLEELKKLIASKDEQIALLKSLLEKK